MPANGGKGQFHSVNQSADRKEREREGGEEEKKRRKLCPQMLVKGKGQFHSLNQSADR